MKINKKYIFFIIILVFLIIARKIGPLVVNTNLISSKFSIRYILIIPLITYFIITKVPIKETLKINRIRLKTIIMIIGISILFFPFLALISDISTDLFNYNSMDMVKSSILDAPLIVLIIEEMIIPPVVEELIFRGIILSNNKEKTIVFSVILNGILFAIFHVDLQRSLYTFFMGVFFAVLVIGTNSIFSSIIAHSTINGINLFFQKLSYQTSINNSSFNPKLQSSSSTVISIPVWITYLIITIITFIGVLLIKKLIKVSK